MTISTHARKSLWKTLASVHDKSLEESRSKTNIHQCKKGYYNKSVPNIIVKEGKVRAFALKSAKRQGCHSLALSISHSKSYLEPSDKK